MSKLISAKGDFRIKITSNIKVFYIMIIGSIQQEDVTILNM